MYDDRKGGAPPNITHLVVESARLTILNQTQEAHARPTLEYVFASMLGVNPFDNVMLDSFIPQRPWP